MWGAVFCVLADILVKPPQKIFIFNVKYNIYRIKVSIVALFNFENKITAGKHPQLSSVHGLTAITVHEWLSRFHAQVAFCCGIVGDLVNPKECSSFQIKPTHPPNYSVFYEAHRCVCLEQSGGLHDLGLMQESSSWDTHFGAACGCGTHYAPGRRHWTSVSGFSPAAFSLARALPAIMAALQVIFYSKLYKIFLGCFDFIDMFFG